MRRRDLLAGLPLMGLLACRRGRGGSKPPLPREAYLRRVLRELDGAPALEALPVRRVIVRQSW
jgi:hypothetical protein